MHLAVRSHSIAQILPSHLDAPLSSRSPGAVRWEKRDKSAVRVFAAHTSRRTCLRARSHCQLITEQVSAARPLRHPDNTDALITRQQGRFHIVHLIRRRSIIYVILFYNVPDIG